MVRPISDKEIEEASNFSRAKEEMKKNADKYGYDPVGLFGVWSAWRLTHAHAHNQTYEDQEFLANAWFYLKHKSDNSVAADNLAHFLSGTGTSKRLSLTQLFQEDGKLSKKFSLEVGKQIHRGESAYKVKGSAELSLEEFLKANLRQYADAPHNSPVDFRKDYGPSPGPYDGHVELDQPDFSNNTWRLATGGLSVLWTYLGATRTSGHKQHRVFAWCFKRYKWHPHEARFSRLVHIAAENAKVPAIDTSLGASQSSGVPGYAGYLASPSPGSGSIRLGSETIGQWKDDGHTRQTIYNPAKEFLLIFPPVERVVPVYIPGVTGS